MLENKRKNIIKCLGKFPLKCNSNLNIESTKEKEYYYENLITYYVELNEKVSAYLLVPKNIKDKTPAIVGIHQHAGQWHIGKSEVVGLGGNEMYHYGVELANQGYVVIAPDLLCFEDRIPNNFNKGRDEHKMYERFMFCKYINEGSCLQTKYLHDLSVTIDILCSLEYVNQKLLGVIGHSLGGQESAWIMWYDKRLKFGIASCGISTMKSLFENNISHNFALYIPGFNTICDIDTLVSAIAPRSFLMTNGNTDKLFPIEGVKQIAETAKNSYEKAGCGENFQSIIFNGGHSFNTKIKEEVYDWINKQIIKFSH